MRLDLRLLLFTVAKQYVFKITVGLLGRPGFRDVEGQGMNRPFWPFQAKKKIPYNQVIQVS